MLNLIQLHQISEEVHFAEDHFKWQQATAANAAGYKLVQSLACKARCLKPSHAIAVPHVKACHVKLFQPAELSGFKHHATAMLKLS